MNIPLWEKRNTVKAAKAGQLVASLNTEEHRIEHFFEIAELYEHYRQLIKRTPRTANSSQPSTARPC